MKKSLLTLLIIFVSTVLHHTASAQCTWQSVGSGTASTGTNTTTYSDLAISSTGIPYVTYVDAGASNLATVRTFSAGAWIAVGSGTLSTNAAYTKIGVSNTGTPYVIYQDGNSGNKARVMSYNGGSWLAVGTGTISADTASYTDITFDNSGTPYVVFVDRASGKKVVVKKYSGGSWQSVGSAVSTSTAAYTSIAIDASGLPYVAYQDVPAGTASVMKYNGSTWAAVGTGTIASTASYITININKANNMPYVSYIGNSYLGSVQTYSAGAWQSVGSTISNAYTSMDMAIDSAGTPYVTYYDLMPYKASTMKYNGSAWVYAGNSGFSAGAPAYSSIAIDAKGTPYMVYSGGSTYAYKLSNNTVMTNQPVTVSFCAGSSGSMGISTNTITGLTYQWQLNTTNSVGAYTNISNGSNYTGVSTASLSLAFTASVTGNYYRCVANDGCINTISTPALLTVHPLPTIVVNSATICAGATKTLTATGAFNYSWSTGATTPAIAVSPTITTTYTLSGTDVNGCSNTASANVSLISSKSFSGTVTSTAGAVSGNVILYRHHPTLSKWDSVAFAPFSSIYSFGIIDSSLYVVKAVPTATNVQITYAPNVISWQGATVISHGCTNNTAQAIQVQPYAAIAAGTGTLAGLIVEGNGYVHKPTHVTTPGNPIPGIVVKGGKNPGASIFAQTLTDNSGHYTFPNLPVNNPGETYFILVDIPGLDTNHTYHKVLTLANNSYTSLDFTVDSMYVNPNNMTTSINEINQADYLVKVFPNPASGYFTIQYSLLQQASVKIELYDVIGKNVKHIQPSVSQGQGNYTQSVPTENLNPGLYFVKLLINNKEATIKLFISN